MDERRVLGRYGRRDGPAGAAYKHVDDGGEARPPLRLAVDVGSIPASRRRRVADENSNATPDLPSALLCLFLPDSTCVFLAVICLLL